MENESNEVCWLNEDCIAGPHTHRVQCRFPSWQDDAAEPDAGDVRGCEGCDRGLCDGLLCDGAEQDAGDVETLARVLSGATPEFAARAAENHMTQARRLLVSDWLAAHDAAVRRKAADDRAEQIAQAIEAGRPEMGLHINVTDYRRGMDDGLIKAALIAGSTR